MLAEPIIITLFERGEFTAIDSNNASLSLIALSMGLLAFMLIKVLTPGFFARQQPKKPVYVALFSMVLNGFLAWLLGFHLGYNHVGLALASSISAFFTITALLYLLRKENIYSFEKGWFLFSIRLICASLILYLTVGLINVDIEVWRNSYEIERFIRLLAILAASMAAYFITLWASGIRLKDLTN
jgi:putative peptidoglycan lipid II flippase